MIALLTEKQLPGYQAHFAVDLDVRHLDLMFVLSVANFL